MSRLYHTTSGDARRAQSKSRDENFHAFLFCHRYRSEGQVWTGTGLGTGFARHLQNPAHYDFGVSAWLILGAFLDLAHVVGLFFELGLNVNSHAS